MANTTYELDSGRSAALNTPSRVLAGVLKQVVALGQAGLRSVTEQSELDRLSDFHLRDIGLERDSHGHPKAAYDDLLARRWPK